MNIEREISLISTSDLFDRRWYLEQNSDVAAAGIDPAKHYLNCGWKECRNPSVKFDGNAYLRANPDVAEAKICPLLHYLKYGKKEGRALKPRTLHLQKCRSKWTLRDFLRIFRRSSSSAAANRICIFASYSGENKIEEYVRYYLKMLKPFCAKIVFVADNPLPESERAKIEDDVCVILAEKHGEYDFGSYKRGFSYARERGWLAAADEIIVCNDSMFGPLRDLGAFFSQKKKDGNPDIYGMTVNDHGYARTENGAYAWTAAPHVQSYFFVLSKNLAKSPAWEKFISSVKREKEKTEIIINYEQGMTKTMTAAGFSFGAFYKPTDDPCVNHFYDLITQGFFIKKTVFAARDYKRVNRLLDKTAYPYRFSEASA